MCVGGGGIYIDTGIIIITLPSSQVHSSHGLMVVAPSTRRLVAKARCQPATTPLLQRLHKTSRPSSRRYWWLLLLLLLLLLLGG